MKKNFYFLSTILFTLFLLNSCVEEKVTTNSNAKGALSFGLKDFGFNARTAGESTPDGVYISVKNDQNTYVLNLEKLTVINIGGEFVTENVEFEVGNYTVEDFIVVDDKDSAIYITPKGGSEFSKLVNNPLPLHFQIAEDSISSVVVEVIPIEEKLASQFGYANFTWNVVDLSSLDSALLIYYPFNGNTYDFGEAGNHAIDSTSGNYIQGVKGYALNFDGHSDFLTLSDSLSTADGLSFSFWVNSGGPTTNQNLGTVFSKYSYNDKNLTISTFGYGENKNNSRISAHYYAFPTSTQRDWLESDLTYDYLIDKGTDTAGYDLIDPTALNINEWVHCVVNATEDHLEIFLNGELTVRKEREYSTYNDSQNEPIYIGNMFNGADGNNNHLNGALDEFRIYNRSLTNLEIQALYLKY